MEPMNRINATHMPMREIREYLAFGYRIKHIDGRLYLQRELDG